MQWRRTATAAGVGLCLAALCLAPAAAQYGRLPPTFEPPNAQAGNSLAGYQFIILFTAVIAGMAFGALRGSASKIIGGIAYYGVFGFFLLLAFTAPAPVSLFFTFLAAFFAYWIAHGLGTMLIPESQGSASRTFGSAKWATGQLVSQRQLVGTQGLTLGYFPFSPSPLPLHYTGDRHLLTVAPTRAGKGVAAIIPNLLTYPGSVLAVDPKGELAMTTALRRGPGDEARGIEGMGQEVHILDPWGLTTEVLGTAPSCFNPLDWLNPASPDVSENAMMLADALVVSAPGASDAFWNEEAKALLMGLILHVAIAPEEAATRHLGRVRDILTSKPADFEAVMAAMIRSPNPVVVSTAARTLGKEEKLQANVISSAQAQTHFLDSPRLRESLSRSDFQFEDLKTSPMTVYLVLPADRLQPFGRWLRLMIQQAITVTARNVTVRPERPILFMLDEMAALGRLTMLEQAYGLMAGFGMQLWGVVQDLSQLHRIYGDGWQTFIGNSGVLQYFGSRDKMTAEYFSDLCGVQTVSTLGSSVTRVFSGQGGSSSSTSNFGETQRKLIMPDELMRVGSHVQLLLIENLDPIAGHKATWYADDRFRRFGVNLREAA